ncbi:MAG: DsbA family protein [Polyangiaceae bacterium]|nr:DsbA family protein [Polyangiaceae bacterium]
MTTLSQLRGAFVAAMLSEPARHARERLRSWMRGATGRARRLELFWLASDPYSHLLAQALTRLLPVLPLELDLVVLPEPAVDVDPEPELRRAFALRDAAEVAPHFGLAFPAAPSPPDAALVARAEAVLLRRRAAAEQLEVAVQVGAALWARDAAALGALEAAHGAVPADECEELLGRAVALARARGHYRGGMVYYEGEWYGGVDRVQTLLERLRAEGLADAHGLAWQALDRLQASPHDTPPPASVAPIFRAAARPGRARGSGATRRPKLELFFSFRSPYSYLALSRTKHFALSYPVDLELRPVLLGGLAMPAHKRRYIVADAKREADRLALPFGRICEPLGLGVERCLAAFEHAEGLGRGFELMQSVMRGIWAEARDPASDADLRFVVERAGLPWRPVRRALGEAAWRARVADNAAALRDAGLWGVPSFRIGDFTTWGQDRIPLVERRIRDTLGWP